MTSRSVLTLVINKLQRELWLAPSPPATDYYLRHATAAVQGRPRHSVAPDVAGPDGQRLWPWLAGFGRGWNLPQATASGSGPALATRRRDFLALVSKPFPVLPDSAYRMACALEWLGGNNNRRSVARVLEIGAEPDPRHALVVPSREWVRSVWLGLFEITGRCMIACGAKPEDVPEELFPALTTSDGTRVVRPIRAWPVGLTEHWPEFLRQRSKDDPWSLQLDEAPNPIWYPSIALWARVRRQARDGPVVSPQPHVSEYETLASWVFKARNQPTDAELRDKDSPWTVRNKQRPALALLLAAMAFDRYMSADDSKWRLLEKAMNDTNIIGVEYTGTAWSRDDLLDLLTERVRAAEDPRHKPSRFLDSQAMAVHSAELSTKRAFQAMRLQPPSFLDGDRSVVCIQISHVALGPDRDATLADWSTMEPTCYVEVRSLDTGQREPPFLAEVEDMETDPTANHMRFAIRPRPALGSRLLDHWDGKISDSDIRYECWLVNAAPDGESWCPVLLLRVTV